jgi:hypothetical protein
MDRRLLHLFLAAGIVLAFFGCSDKNSNQACIHAVTMNLDKGNYNAVLESSCANAMQKGAAYFGLAGFDITQVINNFSKAGSTSVNTQSDLTVYMTNLVSNASGTSISYLDDALQSYDTVTTANDFTLDNYKDAQFYISMVDAVKALSLLKVVLPNLATTVTGSIDLTCDKNTNQVPDDADATACALLASAGQTCSPYATYVQSGPLTFPTVTGTYYGLTITMTGNVTPPNPPCPATYKRLLYTQGTATITATTDSTQTCIATDGSSWPCPLIVNNQPLDLVSAIDQTLTSSLSSLNSSLTSSLTGSTTDVQQAVTDIQAQACCGCTTTPCQPCSNPCTSQDLANYIQTNLK